MRFFDRVKETCTDGSTGTMALDGAAPGFLSITSVYELDEPFYYTIVEASTDEWEVGIGTCAASNAITRLSVLASSNAGALVNFTTSEPKDVFVTYPAKVAAKSQLGRQVAIATGQAMP